VLSGRVFRFSAASAESMTIGGVIRKTFLLLGIVLLSATGIVYGCTSWQLLQSCSCLSSLGAFLLASCTCYKPRWAAVTAPLYAILEGLFLGSISLAFNNYYPGIVIQALFLTVGVLFTMLLVFHLELIEIDEQFYAMLWCAMGSIIFVYLFTFLLALFYIPFPYLHEGGVVGVLFSLFVVGVAAFSVLADFDFIYQNVRYGAPKYMEWYAGFALIVTLVWLYIEILRFLSKLRERKD
jgi:uncharacterized YccA/Bax inhibitor family protein